MAATVPDEMLASAVDETLKNEKRCQDRSDETSGMTDRYDKTSGKTLISLIRPATRL